CGLGLRKVTRVHRGGAAGAPDLGFGMLRRRHAGKGEDDERNCDSVHVTPPGSGRRALPAASAKTPFHRIYTRYQTCAPESCKDSLYSHTPRSPTTAD